MDLKDFDHNGVGVSNGNIFALPFDENNAELVIVPATWDVTVSYGDGTVEGPSQIIEASDQIDYYNHLFNGFWRKGIYSLPIDEKWLNKSKELREKSTEYIKALENGEDVSTFLDTLKLINAECRSFLDFIKHKALYQIEEGKKVAMIGGDHSTSLAMIEALAHEYDSFGILQFDAHADLREAYEGFEYSHASVMYNAIKVPQVKKLVQVGIRDICDEEVGLIKSNPTKIHTYYDQGLKHAMFEGQSWKKICLEIIDRLPEFVYISFDIDGLDPKLCPNTGTPVPGGLEYEQACYLFEQLSLSGRKIIGFDVVEVSNGLNGDWDANVGMRLVYRLCGAMLKSGK